MLHYKEMLKRSEPTGLEIFTPSLDALSWTIERVTKLGCLVVGSVGRAAVFNRYAGGAAIEFERRDPPEAPLLSSRTALGFQLPRDVDIIGQVLPDQGMLHWRPHCPDGGAFNNGEVNVTRERHGWEYQLCNSDPVAIDDAVFEPFHGETIGGVPCETVRPATHAILLEFACRRPNDDLALELLFDCMPAAERQLYESAPFRQFDALLRQRAVPLN